MVVVVVAARMAIVFKRGSVTSEKSCCFRTARQVCRRCPWMLKAEDRAILPSTGVWVHLRVNGPT